MKRRNRSIEVFDISLMAVVTKAMGAFLVLMLIFMSHYKSEPLGEKNAAELARVVADVEARLKALQQRLSEASQDPAELRRLLEQARQQLADAQMLVGRLRRDNEALNSQVRRLEEVEQALRTRLAQLDAHNKNLEQALAENQKVSLSGQMINWDCLDVRLSFGMFSTRVRFESKGGAQPTSVLNYHSSQGYGSALTQDEMMALHDKDAGDRPGSGWRFNSSSFLLRATPGEYFLVFLSTAKAEKEAGGSRFHPLKAPAANCRLIYGLQFYSPKHDRHLPLPVTEFIFPKGEYAQVLYGLSVKEDRIATAALTSEMQEWLRDQIARAEKEVTSSGEPANRALSKDDMERLRRQSEEARKKYLEKEKR